MLSTELFTTSEFGPNVFVFDSSMSMEAIQKLCNDILKQQEGNHFGPERYALLFKPGTYNVEVTIGFYTQAAGLGLTPDEVTINGSAGGNANWRNGNALCNFWRSCENLAVVPASGTNTWAVSQAAPYRRMHIKGDLALWDRGYSSGGFLADSFVEGKIDSGSQQQWYTRNSEIGAWGGNGWNMVFQGVENAPKDDKWPTPPYTTISSTPVVREKPFLYIDKDNKYKVFVPGLRYETKGTTWKNNERDSEGEFSIPLEEFYIAKQETATAQSINDALKQGKNILFTPGVYHLQETIKVTRPNTVILGLGMATLIPDNGIIAMSIADVDGVKVAGLLFDAGEVNSPKLLEVGEVGSSLDHSANPTSLHDVFFRVGGAGAGKADVSLQINSNNVIGDHFWIWRADHGDGVGWDINTTKNGLVVNGNDVTIYGLFVEHYHEYQTLWKGERGRTYFYQCEIPYDVPDQESWMSGNKNGYAGYKVADSVDRHEAWGLGLYNFFRTNPSVKLGSAIEAPDKPGVKFHRMVTMALGGGTYGEITHVINDTGKSANKDGVQQRVGEYPEN
ncbi:coagulation factor 5/8 type domain-containing protein [Clostridium thermarum]|uniref:coagulation factor 5/8 type domain-containing protein n=1 Tax=Clostridium thermarum TaxID=1716543 RepID=UPI00111CFC3E|nr:coagulation factor 5/8 type domain-containing protein [Clostridium thermarum]